MRLAASIEAAHPGRWLRGQAQVTEVGVQDLVETTLVFAFADERGEFVTQGGRIADLAHAIVLERVLRRIAFQHVTVQDWRGHAAPFPLTGTIGTAR